MSIYVIYVSFMQVCYKRLWQELLTLCELEAIRLSKTSSSHTCKRHFLTDSGNAGTRFIHTIAKLVALTCSYRVFLASIIVKKCR